MIVYYIVDSDYKGKRLFRWNQETGKVLQVVVHQGMKKRGRTNAMGIYYIGENSLRSSYLWMQNSTHSHSDIAFTTKKLFDYWFDQVINKLKATI